MKNALTVDGKKICFTGTLTEPRASMESEAASYGGIPVKNLTNDTSFLVVGESAGSKVEKAKEKGIILLTEDEFLNLIDGSLTYEDLGIAPPAEQADPTSAEKTVDDKPLTTMSSLSKKQKEKIREIVFNKATLENPETHEIYRNFYAHWHLYGKINQGEIYGEIPKDLLTQIEKIVNGCKPELKDAGLADVPMNIVLEAALKLVLWEYGNERDVMELASKDKAYAQAIHYIRKKGSIYRFNQYIKKAEGSNADQILEELGINYNYSSNGYIIIKETPATEIAAWMMELDEDNIVEKESEIALHYEDWSPITFGDMKQWEPDGTHELTVYIKSEHATAWLTQLPDFEKLTWIKDDDYIYMETLRLVKSNGLVGISLEYPAWGCLVSREDLEILTAAKLFMKPEWIVNTSVDG